LITYLQPQVRSLDLLVIQNAHVNGSKCVDTKGNEYGVSTGFLDLTRAISLPKKISTNQLTNYEAQ
jgi:hypothetical protein